MLTFIVDLRWVDLSFRRLRAVWWRWYIVCVLLFWVFLIIVWLLLMLWWFYLRSVCILLIVFFSFARERILRLRRRFRRAREIFDVFLFCFLLSLFNNLYWILNFLLFVFFWMCSNMCCRFLKLSFDSSRFLRLFRRRRIIFLCFVLRFDCVELLEVFVKCWVCVIWWFVLMFWVCVLWYVCFCCMCICMWCSL